MTKLFYTIDFLRWQSNRYNRFPKAIRPGNGIEENIFDSNGLKNSIEMSKNDCNENDGPILRITIVTDVIMGRLVFGKNAQNGKRTDSSLMEKILKINTSTWHLIFIGREPQGDFPYGIVHRYVAS